VYLPGAAAPGEDYHDPNQRALCHSILQPDSTCRLDIFEEVHLPSSSFLKAILERVDEWRINIFLGRAIPYGYNPLRKEVQTCITSTIFLHQLPAASSGGTSVFSPVEER